MMKCKVGTIVKSKAGRDNGKFFVVYSILDENYVLLVNGKNKKLSNPKKKKYKHLIVCKEISELREKIEQARYLLDSDIRSQLKNFKLNM